MTLLRRTVSVTAEFWRCAGSLLNTVLEHGNILPMSGHRSCTSVVVRISNNELSDAFEADVEFLAEEEWMEEVSMLLQVLTGRGGKVRTQQPDPDSESVVAWNKVRAVYGPFGADITLEKLHQQTDVTRFLGRTEHISLCSVICCSMFIANK